VITTVPLRDLDETLVRKVCTHSVSGRSAATVRSTKSGVLVAAGSAIVVLHGLPHRLAP